MSATCRRPHEHSASSWMPASSEISFSSYYEVERCFLLAAVLNGVLYGSFLSLAGVSLARLSAMKTLPPKTFSRMAKFLFAVCLVYTLFVVGMSMQAYQILFPQSSPLWTQLPVIVAFCCVTLASGLGDLLFLYRTWIIWERSRFIIIPLGICCIQLVIHLAADVLVAVDGGISDLTVSRMAEKFAVAGMILGLILNVLLSAAAIGRLLLARQHLRQNALPRGGNHYIKISRLLVLTTTLYTAAWLTLLIARRSIWSTVTIVVVFAVCCTCPLVILLHVAGRTQADTLVLPDMMGRTSVHLVELGAGNPRASTASADRMPTFKSNEMAANIDPRPGILWYQSDGLAEDEDIALHCRRLSMTDDPVQ